MSPEQASGQRVDHRADVYAVGVIMYEMIAGRVPFEADTYMGVLTQHMFVQPVPPSQVSASVTELGALEAITLRCLAKKPADRFPSMEALIQAIDDVVRFPGVADPGATSCPPSSRPASGVGRAAARGRGPTAGERWLPSLAEMRVGLERSRPRPRAPSRLSWLPLAVMVGTLLAAPFAVMWLLPRAPPPAVDVRARVAPVLTAPSRDPVPVGLVAAPSPTVVGSIGQAAPSVGGGSPAGPSHSLQPNRRRSVPSAGWPAPLDDVGDPFAGKP
jgi:serine/threonine-protein kinase